jgi:fructoselysine 6-kinase
VRLACAGDVGIDDYVNLNLRRPGGIALNVAVAAQASGLDVSIVSALGDDPDGDAIGRVLAPLGMDVSRVRRLPGATARQAIRLEADGERRLSGYRAGVLAGWRLDRDDLAFLAAHDAVYVPLADGLEAVFEAVARLPGPALKAADFSIDSDLADGSSLVQSLARYAGAFDLVFVGGSTEHLATVAELAAAHPETTFVLTLGAAGALAFHRGERFRQAAVPVGRVVDTTGCGDAFQGAFLASLLQHQNVPSALWAGASRAAAALGHVGATILTLP